MKNTIKILCLILLSTCNLSAWTGAITEENSNTSTETKCEGLRVYLEEKGTASIFEDKRLILSESKTDVDPI